MGLKDKFENKAEGKADQASFLYTLERDRG